MQSKPNPYEIEISVFGPGIGEAIVFHYLNNWILIDSCFNYKTSQPTSLSYLKSLSVDLNSVKLIVITHWHDDHIKGAAQLIEHCPNAKIVLPSVLELEDFRKLVLLYSQPAMVNPNGVDEVSKILKLLLTERHNFVFGDVDKLLYRDQANHIEVYSISPSGHARMKNEFSLSSRMSTCTQRINPPKHNYFSIGVLINVDESYFLFGADLENHNSEMLGWGHVLKYCTSIRGKKSSYFKLAHHGSHNGDNPDLWKNHLNPNPISTVTPYNRGKTKLPSDDDVKRIKSRTTELFLTCSKESSKFKDKNTSKIAEKKLQNLRVAGNICGHIRTRIDKNTKVIKTETFEGAVKL